MPYVKEPAPTNASLQELVRYYDGELEKLVQSGQEQDSLLEALNIIGCSATWFWDDTILGEPAPGFMRGDNNTLQAMTQINVNYVDAQGRDITQLLKTSTIEVDDLIGLVVVSGLGAGNYVANAPVVFQANHIEIFVDTFNGAPGNPQPDDVMGLRWEFSAAPPQGVI